MIGSDGRTYCLYSCVVLTFQRHCQPPWTHPAPVFSKSLTCCTVILYITELCNFVSCRFKPYWVPVGKMYNATASSNGLAQGGHRGLARVTAQQGSASLATPSQYESDTLRSESDDTASIQSDATSDSTTSSTAQRGSSSWAGAVAGILLAFCVGAIVGAVAYRGHEQRMSPLDTHSSELVEQHRLLNQQSSLSQNQNL